MPQPTTLEWLSTAAAAARRINAPARSFDAGRTVHAGPTKVGVLQNIAIGAARVVGTVLNRVEEHAIPMRDYYDDHYSDRS